LQGKTDWDTAKSLFDAWWKHESKKPLIQAFSPKADVDQYYALDGWAFLRNKGAFAQIIHEFKQFRDCTFFGGTAYPNLWLNLGPGALAAYLSNFLEFSNEQSTTWFEKTRDWDAVEAFDFDEANPWWQYTLQMAEAAAPNAPGAFILATTDIGGNLDVLASLRGTQELLMDLVLEPERITQMLSRIDDTWERVYTQLDQIIRGHGQDGTAAWMGLWCPERWYPLQCDFSAMISPHDFERFVIPSLVRHCRFLDKSIFHWDGPGQIPHLDLLLDIPELDGIQWVPGSGNPQCENPCWYPLYEKILAKNKLLILQCFDDNKNIPTMLQVFQNPNILISTWYPTENEAQDLLEFGDQVMTLSTGR